MKVESKISNKTQTITEFNLGEKKLEFFFIKTKSDIFLKKIKHGTKCQIVFILGKLWVVLH